MSDTNADHESERSTEELEQRVDQLEEVVRTVAQKMQPRRRDVMIGAAGIATGAAGIASLSEPAAAEDNVNSIGTADDPLEAIHVEELHQHTDHIYADSFNNTIGDSSIQTAWDGLVVPVGQGIGPDDAVDPDSTATPVKDAISVVEEAGGGTVLLPNEEITEDEGITLPKAVNLRGVAQSDTLGETVTRITIENETDELLRIAEDDTTAGQNFIDRVELHGDDATLSNAAIYAPDNVARLRIGQLSVRNFVGVGMHFESDWFESTVDYLRMFAYDAGNEDASVILSSCLGVDWRTSRFDPTDTTSGADSDILKPDGHARGDWPFLNCGGTVGQLLTTPGDGRGLSGRWRGGNYEPVDRNSNPGAIAELAQYGQTLRIDYIDGDTTDTVDYVFRISRNPIDVTGTRRIVIPQQSDNVTTQNVVGIEDEPGGPIVYQGHSSDVDNNTGDTLSEPNTVYAVDGPVS